MPAPEAEEDLLLVRQVLDGSIEAWHELILRYTGLIRHAIGQVVRDREDVATVHATVLEKLCHGQLARYRGEARLGTWLVFVARSSALDHRRRRRGRSRLPERLRALGPLDREVYRLRFEQGLEAVAIRPRLAALGFDPAALEASLERLESRLGRADYTRLAWEREARAVAAESGRLLRFLAEEREERARRAWAASPEVIRLERLAEETAGRIRATIESLPPSDREVLALRFDRGLPAKEIALRLGLEGSRQAFTRIDAALRRLRRALQIVSGRTPGVAPAPGNPPLGSPPAGNSLTGSSPSRTGQQRRPDGQRDERLPTPQPSWEQGRWT